MPAVAISTKLYVEFWYNSAHADGVRMQQSQVFLQYG